MNRLAPAAMAFLFLLAASPAVAAPPTELSVSGMGSVTLVPDLATVDAAIETNAPTVTAAIGENNARYDRVVAALTHLGIARTDIALSNYNVNYNPKPESVTETQPGQQYGYTVTRTFSVKVRRITKAGEVVDACTAAGATGINGVSFGVADSKAARDRALTQAVADARASAEKLARAAGLHVVGIKSLDLGGGPIVPQVMMAKAAVTAMPPTQFDQSNVTVTVNVNAVYLAQP
jgi:uncharacterized protein YggE